MFNPFKRKKNDAIQQLWQELCELDHFLHHEFVGYINRQSHLDINNCKPVMNPYKTLEKQRTNLPYELYKFTREEIFFGVLKADFDQLLDVGRGLIEARQRGLVNEEKLKLTQINSVAQQIPGHYLKKLNEFRDLAEKYSGERFEFNKN